MIKHAIPKPIKHHLAEVANNAIPDGLIKDNVANAITIGGAVLVEAGARIDGKAGLTIRAVGELADDLDGDTSRFLGTSSRFGALLDAILDKYKMTRELQVLWGHTDEMEPVKGTLRKIALGVIATKHVANTSINTVAFVQGVKPETSFAGSVNVWMDGFSVAAFGISDVSEPNSELSRRTELAGYVMTAASIPVGIVATIGYYKSYRQGLIDQALTIGELANNTTQLTI